MKKFLWIVVGVAASVLIGTALMILTYSLPTERITENVRAGLPLYEREGTYPSWALGEHSKLDNFTDAIMLLEATHPIKNVVESSMLNPRFGLNSEEKPVDALIQVLSTDAAGLSEIVYPRYWHGYLIVLKPLLMVMKVNHVRMLLAYADFILFVAALLTIQKILGNAYALALAAAVMTLNLVSLSMSFQFSTVYIVTLSAVIFMLKKNRRLFDTGCYDYFFAAIGIVVAFMDFLTYPIFSVGLPLTIFYLLNRGELLKEKFSRTMKLFGELLISWGVGYFGMWSGKWFISQLLTGYNTFSDAFGQILSYSRLGNNLAAAGWQITSFGAIQRNIAVLGHGPIRIFLFTAVILLVYVLIRYRRTLTLRKILPYLFPAALPILWFGLVSGHSHIHAFFTYRGLAVTIFALACMAAEFVHDEQSSVTEVSS